MADYEGLTPKGWEKLGKTIREAEARISGPAGNSVGRELSEYSAKSLNAWHKMLEERVTDIKIDAEERINNFHAVQKQIQRALDGDA